MTESLNIADTAVGPSIVGDSVAGLAVVGLSLVGPHVDGEAVDGDEDVGLHVQIRDLSLLGRWWGDKKTVTRSARKSLQPPDH